jgi:hypothetical protein
MDVEVEPWEKFHWPADKLNSYIDRALLKKKDQMQLSEAELRRKIENLRGVHAAEGKPTLRLNLEIDMVCAEMCLKERETRAAAFLARPGARFRRPASPAAAGLK